MLNRLIFFSKKQKYKKFHKGSKFSQNEVAEILRKVRFNFPETYNRTPNLKNLKDSGIKIDCPIYVEDIQKITKSYLKNLWLAKKIFDFNLVIFYRDSFIPKPSYKKFLNGAKFLNLNYVNFKLKQDIFLLNINRQKVDTISYNYKDKIDIKNWKSDMTRLNDFCLSKLFFDDKNFIEIKQTYFNGFYYFINIEKYNNNKKIIILLKKIIKNIKNNYFLIKKIKNGYLINNYMFDKKYYFLTNLAIKNFRILRCFKDDSIEINAELFIVKKSDNFPNYFVYLGEENFDFFCSNISEEIIKKINEKFNIKIKTNVNKIDYFFNQFLPKKIILEKLTNFNFTDKINQITINNISSILEPLEYYKSKKISADCCYNLIKNSMFNWHKDSIVFSNKLIKNFSLKMFYQDKIKNFEIYSSKQIKLIIGNIEYINCKAIPINVLKTEDDFIINL